MCSEKFYTCDCFACVVYKSIKQCIVICINSSGSVLFAGALQPSRHGVATEMLEYMCCLIYSHITQANW